MSRLSVKGTRIFVTFLQRLRVHLCFILEAGVNLEFGVQVSEKGPEEKRRCSSGENKACHLMD